MNIHATEKEMKRKITMLNFSIKQSGQKIKIANNMYRQSCANVDNPLTKGAFSWMAALHVDIKFSFLW